MPLVRGPYHQRLRDALRQAVTTEGISYASLAAAIAAKEPSGIGRYLRGDTTAGELDLDRAHLALRHCGLGGLREFVSDVPPLDTPIPPRVLAFLQEHPEFRQLLSDLLDVPQQSHAEVLSIWQPAVRALRKKRRGGPSSGTTADRRTTAESAKRR